MVDARSAACRWLQVVLVLGCLAAGEALAAGPVGVRLPTGGELSADDQLACAVGVSGDTLLATNYLDDLDQAPGYDAGAAFLFIRDAAGGWIRLQKLSDGAAGGEFGGSVALDDDLLVVGAPGADSGAGAAYVFRGSDGGWVHEQTLRPADGIAGGGFGRAVAADGEAIAVGAPGDDDRGTLSGAVYVYAPGSPWELQAKLLAPDGTAFSSFGHAVAVGGDELVAGAPGDDFGAGGQTVANAGAAYVFARGGGAWSSGLKLHAGPPGEVNVDDRFGSAVALAGNRLLVGSPGDERAAADGGAAYLFVRDGSWPQVPTLALTSPEPGAGDAFGFGLDLDGSRALVGAYLDDDEVLGLVDSGSAFVFELEGTNGQVADLQVSFDAEELVVEPGATFVFEVTAANDSDLDVSAPVEVDLTFPPEVPERSCTCQAYDGAQCNDPCEIEDLSPVFPAHSRVTYEMTARALASATGSADVEAVVNPGDPNPGNNRDTITLRFVRPPPMADLSIACVDPDPLWARPGETVTVGLRVVNDGPDDVTGALVTATGLVSCIPAAYCPGGSGFEVTLLADRPPVSLTLTADVPSSPVAAPRFEILPPAGVSDPVQVNNDTQECVQILQVLCEENEDEAVPGEPIELIFSIENLGPSDLVGADIAVTLNIDLESEGLTCDPPEPCPPENLAAGVPVELTLSGGVPSAATGQLSIDVTITPTPPGGEPAAFTVCPTELIPMFDDPEVGCDLEEPVVAGEPVEVTVSIENPGPSDLVGASVAMTPNIDLESEGLTCDPPEPCPPEDFAAGVPVELTLAGDVPPGATGMFSVDVEITSSAGEEVFSDDVCVTPILQVFDDPVVGCNLGGPVVAGEPVAVTISIENPGPSDLVGASIAVTPSIGLETELLSCDTPGPCPPEVLFAGIPVELTLTGGIPCSATGLFSVDVVITPPGGEEIRFASLCPTDLMFDDPIVGCDLGEPVIPGEPVAVTVSIENPGPCDLAGAAIAVTPNIDLESEDLTCDPPGPCPPEVLAAGIPVDLVLTGGVPSSETGPFFVDVAITPPGGEEMRFEGLCPSELTPKIDLSITCEHPRSARPGETVDFRLGVANAGPSDAPGARLTASNLEACVPGALCLGGISRTLVADESLILTPRGRILTEELPRFRLDPPAGVLELDPTDNVIPCPPVFTPRVPALSDLGEAFLAVLLLAALTAATWRRIGGAG